MSRDELDGLDKWLTTTPEDSAHLPECNCDECHADHDVSELAGDVDFKCCTEALAEAVASGEVCAAKPKEHFNIYMDGKKCLQCEHEQIWKVR